MSNNRVPQSTRMGQNVVIMDNVEIGENCNIGNNVVIYPKTKKFQLHKSFMFGSYRLGNDTDSSFE